MFCPNCGVKLPDISKFCSNCGNSLPSLVNNGYEPDAPAQIRTTVDSKPHAGSTSSPVGKRKILLIAAIAVAVIGITVFAIVPANKGSISISYKIGDRGPGGGTIFYVSAEGFTVEGYGKRGDPGYFASYTAHYLEAAPKDSGTAQWGAYGTFISGITTIWDKRGELTSDYARIGNGRKDTLTIAAFLTRKGERGRATQLAASASFGGLNDWFLPSFGETKLLSSRRIRKFTGFGMTAGSFWTSTQWSDTLAMCWAFYYQGGRYLDDIGDEIRKNATATVRAIRAF